MLENKRNAKMHKTFQDLIPHLTQPEYVCTTAPGHRTRPSKSGCLLDSSVSRQGHAGVVKFQRFRPALRSLSLKGVGVILRRAAVSSETLVCCDDRKETEEAEHVLSGSLGR